MTYMQSVLSERVRDILCNSPWTRTPEHVEQVTQLLQFKTTALHGLCLSGILCCMIQCTGCSRAAILQRFQGLSTPHTAQPVQSGVVLMVRFHIAYI